MSLLLVFIFFNSTAIAQADNYPQGLYMNLQEVLDKNPSADHKVALEQRSSGKIKMNGGNDYQINSEDKSIKRSFLLKEVYAYSEGSALYLNCFKYELQAWYSKVEGENTKYFFFKAGIPMNSKRYGFESSDLSSMFGGVFAAFGAAKRAMVRLPYLLDKHSGEVVLVADKNIREFIGTIPQLFDDYEKEQEKDNVDVISTYILKWIETK